VVASRRVAAALLGRAAPAGRPRALERFLPSRLPARLRPRRSMAVLSPQVWARGALQSYGPAASRTPACLDARGQSTSIAALPSQPAPVVTILEVPYVFNTRRELPI
jgi:hypothetical protein